MKRFGKLSETRRLVYPKPTYLLIWPAWHELHDYISETKMKVNIPFAERIVDYIPVQSFKIQRDFPKFLSMIKACALVHFNQRDVDCDKNIVANRSDYEAVYNLLNIPISEGLESSVKDGIRDVVQSVHEIYSLGGAVDGISQSKLAEHMKMDRSVVGRNLHAAISQGYLIDQNPGQGRESKVIVGDRKLPSGNALPSPDEIFPPIKEDKKIMW